MENIICKIELGDKQILYFEDMYKTGSLFFMFFENDLFSTFKKNEFFNMVKKQFKINGKIELIIDNKIDKEKIINFVNDCISKKMEDDNF